MTHLPTITGSVNVGDWTDGTDEPTPKPPKRKPAPTPAPAKPKPRTEFPLWFRMVAVTVALGCLGFNVYRGGDVAVSVMLGGLIGAALQLTSGIGKPK